MYTTCFNMCRPLGAGLLHLEALLAPLQSNKVNESMNDKMLCSTCRKLKALAVVKWQQITATATMYFLAVEFCYVSKHYILAQSFILRLQFLHWWTAVICDLLKHSAIKSAKSLAGMFGRLDLKIRHHLGSVCTELRSSIISRLMASGVSVLTSFVGLEPLPFAVAFLSKRCMCRGFLQCRGTQTN